MMIFGKGRSDIPDEILKPFGTVPDSMFILFKIMNGAQSDSDATAIDTLMAKLPAMKFAFVSFPAWPSKWTAQLSKRRCGKSGKTESGKHDKLSAMPKRKTAETDRTIMPRCSS